MHNNLFRKCAQALLQGDSLLVGGGAGMGTDSGLPDFRGNQGFWKNYPPYRNKFSFMECANPNFLRDHPHLFWGFYGSRLIMYRDVVPHKGFEILKNIGKQKGSHFTITSNVDGHFGSGKVYEVHGNIHYLQCVQCNSVTENKFQPIINQKMECQNLPQCSTCKQILRPNILMFDDYEWNSSRSDRQEQEYKQYLNQNINKKVVMIEIGCGTAIPTIRNFLERYLYINKMAKLIRINLDDDSALLNERYIYLKYGALKALDSIRKQLQKI